MMLADADFDRALDASRAVLDAERAVKKARMTLSAVIAEIAEDLADDRALAILRAEQPDALPPGFAQEFPAVTNAFNAYLLDCIETDVEPLTFADWLRGQSPAGPLPAPTARTFSASTDEHIATATGAARFVTSLTPAVSAILAV